MASATGFENSDTLCPSIETSTSPRFSVGTAEFSTTGSSRRPRLRNEIPSGCAACPLNVTCFPMHEFDAAEEVALFGFKRRDTSS
mmetsp:Transcript_29441/g.60199  ORF Transcript_29441/g.60199 Transcript_29441/m.60199 type:complete len:85 (-) Transcript_29441:475-729(-)